MSKVDDDGEVNSGAVEVRWVADEPEALEEAKRTGKPILLDFLDQE